MIVQDLKTFHLRSYNLPLDDLCGSSYRIVRANLLHSWEGPVEKIIRVRSSPESRFVVLTDGVNIEVYQITGYQLFYISMISSNLKIGNPVFTWMRDGIIVLIYLKLDTHLICGFGSSIGVYHVSCTSCELVLSLPGIDDSEYFSFISTYLEDSVEYILGVTNKPDLYVYLWVIENHAELNTISIRQILKKRVPVGTDDCICIRRATFFEKRQDYNIGPYLFGTLSSTGVLKCWHLGWRGILKELSQDTVECITVLEQQIPEAELFHFGRIGYVSTVNSGRLTIWQSNNDALSFLEDATLLFRFFY